MFSSQTTSETIPGKVSQKRNDGGFQPGDHQPVGQHTRTKYLVNGTPIRIKVESGDLGRLERLNLVRQHGAFTMAYSTAVQKHLKYFGDRDGYIAFGRRWGISFALADPVVNSFGKSRLIREFIAEHPNACFCQTSRCTAEILSKLGWFVNEMGVDTRIELPEYDFNGKRKEWMRYGDSWIRKRGYQVVELDIDSDIEILAEGVSEAWKATRTVKKKEVRFLNRPIEFRHEVDTRKFFLIDPEGRLLAFVFFDPVYRNGEIVGYTSCTKRRHPDTPRHGEAAIMKQAIERFQSEGLEFITLGLSPLAEIEDKEFHSSGPTRWMFRAAVKAGWLNRHFYNLRGHSEYKKRFAGENEKVYFASRNRWNARRIFALLSLTGAI